MLPNTRFYGCGINSPALTSADVLTWASTHKFIWYKAPMSIDPQFVRITSKVKTWKSNPNRFEFTIQDGDGLKYRIDEKHLDRLRLEYPEWHHGISARVYPVRFVGDPIEHLCLHQSNGFVHTFDKLEDAIHFAKCQNMTLTDTNKTVLYEAVPTKARFS